MGFRFSWSLLHNNQSFKSAFRMPTSRSYPRHLVQFCEKDKRKEKHFTSLQFENHKCCISGNAARVPKGYHRLPQVTTGYHRLPSVTTALCSDLLHRVCIKSAEQYILLGATFFTEKNYILKKLFFVTHFEIESWKPSYDSFWNWVIGVLSRLHHGIKGHKDVILNFSRMGHSEIVIILIQES